MIYCKFRQQDNLETFHKKSNAEVQHWTYLESIQSLIQNSNYLWKVYTECPRRNVPDFGKVFLMLKYTDITQNTYIYTYRVSQEECARLWEGVPYVKIYQYNPKHLYIYTYRVSQEECARLWEGVPYVKIYRYNPKHLCPKLNGYGDNGQRSLKL